jgi:hypothetical protein
MEFPGTGTFSAMAAPGASVPGAAALGALRQVAPARAYLLYAEERLAQTIDAVERARREALHAGRVDPARCSRLATDYFAAKRHRDLLRLPRRGA